MYVPCFKVFSFTIILIIARVVKILLVDMSSQILKSRFVLYSDRLFTVWCSFMGKESIVETHEDLESSN